MSRLSLITNHSETPFLGLQPPPKLVLARNCKTYSFFIFLLDAYKNAIHCIKRCELLHTAVKGLNINTTITITNTHAPLSTLQLPPPPLFLFPSRCHAPKTHKHTDPIKRTTLASLLAGCRRTHRLKTQGSDSWALEQERPKPH